MQPHFVVIPQNRVTIGHLAARGGHIPVLAVLQARGFDLHSDTIDRNTILHHAVQHGQASTVTWLLQQGVKPNIANFDRKTPLDLAIAEYLFSIITILKTHLEAGAASTGSSGPGTPTKQQGGLATHNLAPGGSVMQNPGPPVACAGSGSYPAVSAPMLTAYVATNGQQQQTQTQQQQQQQQHPSPFQAYPDNELYKFYPTVDPRNDSRQ